VKNVYSVNDWNKTDNQALFLNIELIDEAIERKCQIDFDYNKFGTDKKLHKSAFHKASPYQLILHNQRYYLMALNEKWHNMGYYRLDRISNMRLNDDAALTDIRTVEGFEKGIDYKQFSSALPYMFTDKHEKIELKAQERIVDQIVDWFGKDIKITSLDEEYVQVELVASPNAMEFWAMQYMNFVEVVKPIELRERIKTNLEKAKEKYE
jgi:predicted DNA-binding transcriptional regulator YafY